MKNSRPVTFPSTPGMKLAGMVEEVRPAKCAKQEIDGALWRLLDAMLSAAREKGLHELSPFCRSTGAS